MARKKRGSSAHRPTASELRRRAGYEKQLRAKLKMRDELDLEIMDLKIRMAMSKAPTSSDESCLVDQIVASVERQARKKR